MTKIREIRNNYTNTLLLDAGDQYQGTLWFYIYKGQAAALFMNLLGYDAMAFGNHEFDNGVDGLSPLLDNATFALLSCNIDATNVPKMAAKLHKSKVFTVGGERIGIIGYTTRDTPDISNPGNLKFTDEVQAIQLEVDALIRQGINKIIALGHSGFDVDLNIAKSVVGLDIVVGGHTNTFLYNGKQPSNDIPVGTYPQIVVQSNGNKVLVVQDYAFGKYLGLLHLTFDATGTVTSWSGNPVLLDSTIPEDPIVLNRTNIWKENLMKHRNTTVGRTHVFLDGAKHSCRLAECNMGNLISDGLVMQNLRHPDGSQWTNVSIALVNSGSIRNSLTEGYITLEDVVATQPFRNGIDIVELEGRHLLSVLEHSVSNYNTVAPNGGFMQMSGLIVHYDLSKPVGQRVVKVDVRCSACRVPEFEPLQVSRVYGVLIPGFIIKGGDGYTMIEKIMHRHHINGDLDSDVLAEYIKKRSPIIQGLEGRIVFITEEDKRKRVTCAASTRKPTTCISAVLTLLLLIFLRM
ncbi:5'-nucleotidase-like [Tubulanus polymorphus]|uniref:5'-nucleotidase-like n=1 Tax=Tubulanus polymorphus TaxID=672921 RepID=UPI003DA48E91